jgi:hypothetical protein
LPTEIPGRYFVVEYSRVTQQFKLTLDLPDKPSYDLGGNMDEIVRRFRRWGHEAFGCDACDFAREFGGVQAIFNGRRLRSLHRMRGPAPRPDPFAQPERTSYALPSLA